MVVILVIAWIFGSVTLAIAVQEEGLKISAAEVILWPLWLVAVGPFFLVRVVAQWYKEEFSKW